MGALGCKADVTTGDFPEERFTTLQQETNKQFSYWRDFLAPLASSESNIDTKRGFRAAVRAQSFGKFHTASVTVDPMIYRRTDQHLKRADFDHWQLVLRKQGREFSRSGSRILHSAPGSIDLRSYTRPCEATIGKGSQVCLWLNRDDFSEIGSALDAASHRSLKGPMGAILSEFILSLDSHRKGLTHRDVPAVTDSLRTLLAAAVRPCADTFAEAEQPISLGLFELARKYIDANLGKVDLSIASLCKELHISRRKLYYLFEEQGGVCAYIRQRRLVACRRALENNSDRRFVSTIAYEHGFKDARLFSRQFREQFGYSPREARDAMASSAQYTRSQTAELAAIPANTPGSIANWLLGSRA